MDRLVALSRMRQSGAFLSTSEGLILQLVGDAAHPQFKEVLNPEGKTAGQHRQSVKGEAVPQPRGP